MTALPEEIDGAIEEGCELINRPVRVEYDSVTKQQLCGTNHKVYIDNAGRLAHKSKQARAKN